MSYRRNVVPILFTKSDLTNLGSKLGKSVVTIKQGGVGKVTLLNLNNRSKYYLIKYLIRGRGGNRIRNLVAESTNASKVNQ